MAATLAPFANLSGANFTNANFTNADLGNGDLHGATGLSTATLTGANLAHVNLSNTDLSSVDLSGNDLSGTNLSGSDLTNSNFSGAFLFGASLIGADTRAHNFQSAILMSASTTNQIRINGHVSGLDLTTSTSLTVRDYDGNPATTPPTGPTAIVVERHLVMNTNSILSVILDSDAWDSTISLIWNCGLAPRDAESNIRRTRQYR